jgi:hypothetical protein
MLPFCRPSVEKFIFNKLYFVVYDIYNIKYSEENKKFTLQQEALLKNFSIKEIMDYLEVSLSLYF